MTNFCLKILLKSYTQEEIYKFTQIFAFCEILTLDVLLRKSHTKTTQDVEDLCTNFLHIGKKLCAQGIFNRNVFVVTTFFSKMFKKYAYYYIYLNILIYVTRLKIYYYFIERRII